MAALQGHARPDRRRARLGTDEPRGVRRPEGQQGALYVGSPETVARKIAGTARLLGLTRFDLKYSMGTLPHEAMMSTIELYGTQVVPMVRDLLSEGS